MFPLFLHCSDRRTHGSMEYKMTLPGLQASLDRLAVAQRLALAKNDVERLFGLNDVALTRMERFASGHNCIITHANSCVVFEKMAPSSRGPISTSCNVSSGRKSPVRAR